MTMNLSRKISGCLGAMMLISSLPAAGAEVVCRAECAGAVAENALAQLRSLTGCDTVSVSMPSDWAGGAEGYELRRKGQSITLSAGSPSGLLYGAMHLAMRPVVSDTTIFESPAFALRVLNHWDNPDGTIERGYAGRSIWEWDSLPETVSPVYDEYGRRCAAVGINVSVLNNVNAKPEMLTSEMIKKAAAIADALRPWGIRTALSVNFASPMALGELPTADPLDPSVCEWWEKKASEIYTLIPDFCGFLVKANSEGEPGPMDFGRSHSEGANMLAKALKPHGGIVMWRAFVYSPEGDDRASQAYDEFKPLDGLFDPNVIVQIKNGPIDFQPREPHSPLFGAMPGTPQMVEFQVTQEYLGHANHVAFLAPMWREFFDAVSPEKLTAVAGVANIGDSPNLTGHPMADANWWAFGRLAWNPDLSPEEIAEEWVSARLLNGRDSSPSFSESKRRLVEMLAGSYEAVVDYTMPLGLHHLFAFGHHYGPEPWCAVEGARPDWLPSYYHRADSKGLGFDRTHTGSNAVSRYSEPWHGLYASLDSCPDNMLLWFHHVPWNHRMQSGLTLWEDLCHHYARGIAKVEAMQDVWNGVRQDIDPEVWAEVDHRLGIQHRDAIWWKDACLLYFQQFSGLPLTDEALPAQHTLSDLMKVSLPIDNYTNPTAAQLDAVR